MDVFCPEKIEKIKDQTLFDGYEYDREKPELEDGRPKRGAFSICC